MFGGKAGVAYDVCYHSACDNAKNLNYGAWIVMTKAIAHMTATFARSFDLLPPRNETVKFKRMAAAKEKRMMSEKAYGHLWGI